MDSMGVPVPFMSPTPKAGSGNDYSVYAHSNAAFTKCSTPHTFRITASVPSTSYRTPVFWSIFFRASAAPLNIRYARMMSRTVMRILRAVRNMGRGPFWGGAFLIFRKIFGRLDPEGLFGFWGVRGGKLLAKCDHFDPCPPWPAGRGSAPSRNASRAAAMLPEHITNRTHIRF